MNAQTLFLKPDQVPVGMLVHICASDTGTPETDDDGNKLPSLKLLFGGIPMRAKWYIFDPVENGMRRSAGFEYDAIRADTHFTPVETFSADNAPVRKEYAVFVNGERLKYDDYPKESVKVATTTDGRIVSFNGYAYNHWLREFKLSKDAILVQTGDFAAAWDFTLLGCIGIPKPTNEQRATLEKLGVVFFDHAPFASCGGMVHNISVGFHFHDYVAVRLPKEWRVTESGGWYFKCPFAIEIQDSKERPVARIHQTPRECTEQAMWTGTLNLV